MVSSGGRRQREIESMVEIFKYECFKQNPFIIYKNVFRLLKIIKKNNINIIHARSRAPHECLLCC